MPESSRVEPALERLHSAELALAALPRGVSHKHLVEQSEGFRLRGSPRCFSRATSDVCAG